MLHIDLGRQWRGGQRQCALLCQRLATAGERVELCVRRGSALERVEALSAVPRHTLRVAGEADPLAILHLARLLRRLQPGLIAVHEAHGLALALLARRLAGGVRPVVYHRRIDVAPRGGLASRWKLQGVALFICVSRGVAAVLQDSGIGADRIRIVHDGVPTAERLPGAGELLRAQLGFGAGVPVIGTVGGLIPHKGHAVLLTAFRELLATNPGCHLVIVGSGPLLAALREKAEGLGVASRVAFLGEREDALTLLGGFDLFVLPSLTEGLGSSILDAFALEVPVVATRTGGIPELLTAGETGWLADPGSAGSLASVMDEALTDPQRARAMTQAAHARFQERFTDAAMAAATLDVYREVLAG